MAMGVPVVSTTLGCEGLEVEHGKDIIIADTAYELTVQINRLLDDSSLRAEIGQRARLTVERRYEWKNIVDAQERAYECAIDRKRSLKGQQVR
jgi:glycosyltransferase involved in cell wall biosynthesis